MTRIRASLPFDVDWLPHDTRCPVEWVVEMTGLKADTIRKKARQGSFPPALRHPGVRSLRWRLGEVRQWKAARSGQEGR